MYQKLPNCFPYWLYHFAFPQWCQIVQATRCPCQHLFWLSSWEFIFKFCFYMFFFYGFLVFVLVFLFVYFDHSMMFVVPYCGFNLHFSNHVEHLLCADLSSIPLLSKMSVQIFLPVVFLVVYSGNKFLNMWSANTFSLFVACLLFSLQCLSQSKFKSQIFFSFFINHSLFCI